MAAVADPFPQHPRPLMPSQRPAPPALPSDQPITAGTFPGWWMVAISAAAQFMSGPGQSYSVAAFKDPMRTDLGISETSFSVAYAVATLLSGLCLPFVGRLVDRHGARRVLPLVAAVLGLACWTMSQAQSLAGLCLGFSLIRSLGQGSLTLVAMWIVGEWFARKRGLATAVSGLGSSLSVMTFPLINGLLISSFGWRSSWAVLGTLVWAALILPTVFVLRDRPEDIGLLPDGLGEPDQQPTAPQRSHADSSAGRAVREQLQTEHSWTVREVLHDATFWKLLSVPATSGLIITGLTFHQVALLGSRGVGTVAALGLISFQALVATVCSLPAGWLTDRVASRRLLSLAMLFLAAASTVVLGMPTARLAIVYAMLLGLQGAILRSAGNVVWLNYYGRTHQGGIRGVAMSAMILAAALGPLPFALSIDHFGSYDIALIAFIAIPLTSAVIVATAGPPRGLAQHCSAHWCVMNHNRAGKYQTARGARSTLRCPQWPSDSNHWPGPVSLLLLLLLLVIVIVIELSGSIRLHAPPTGYQQITASGRAKPGTTKNRRTRWQPMTGCNPSRLRARARARRTITITSRSTSTRDDSGWAPPVPPSPQPSVSADPNSVLRGARNGHHCRVLQTSLDRNGVEALFHLGNLPHDSHTILPAHLPFDRRGGCKQPFTGLAKHLQHRTVLKLVHHLRSNIPQVEPLLQTAPERCVLGGQQHRCAGQ